MNELLPVPSFIDATPETVPASKLVGPRHSLMWRVLYLTLLVMLVTEMLVFLPAISREQRSWIDARVVAAQMAAMAVPATPPLPGTEAAGADRRGAAPAAGAADAPHHRQHRRLPGRPRAHAAAEPAHRQPAEGRRDGGGRAGAVGHAARVARGAVALWRNARMAAPGAAVARVSHDLRGVLSPAMLAAERLQSSPDPKVARAGDAVQSSLDRALALVRGTLAFASEVPVAPRLEPVVLRDIVEEVADQVRAMRPGLTVHNLLASGQTVALDRGHMLRVLGNLMRNAAEAGCQNLRVACTWTDQTVQLSITDDGPGLPARVQQALFRPFVTSGKPGGTGLGPAISRDLLRSLNADLVLVHTGAGGSQFRVTLPAKRGDGLAGHLHVWKEQL